MEQQRFQGQQELGRGTQPLQGLRIDTAAQRQPTSNIQFVQETGQTSGMDDDDAEEGDSFEDDDFDDELSSSPSVPDEDIDFEHVYALHTFLASVEGQASVSKGDSLVLLDDSNSYWWLVRVLKSQGVGYIPAENIETPYERLARLNKHRNVDLTTVTQDDHLNGPGSAAAVIKIVSPIHDIPHKPSRAPRTKSIKGRNVQFTAPTYYEHSGNEWSEEGEEGSEFTDDDEALGAHQQNGFEDETDESEEVEESQDEDVAMAQAHPHIAPVEHHTEEESAGDDEDEEYGPNRQPRKKVKLAKRLVQATIAPVQEVQAQQAVVQQPLQPQSVNVQQQQQTAPQQQQARAVSPNGTPQPPKSIDQMLQEQSSQPYNPQVQPQPQRPPQQAKGHVQIVDPLANASNARPRQGSNPTAFDPNAETRKISLTPKIALDGPAGASDATLVEPPLLLLQPQAMQQARSFSGSSQYSAYSRDDASSDGHLGSPPMDGSPSSPRGSKKSQKQGANVSPVNADDKKKSGGMFSGLFGRKKDKKEKSGSVSPVEREKPLGRAGAFSPTPAQASIGVQQRQWKEHDAYMAEQTLKQQQIEAQQAMYQNFGISRGPADQTNQFSPRSSAALSASPNSGQPRMRPGSLIGSPGMDVPILNVLRIFAGDSVLSEATFKTVLLSETTSTTELLRQALQRFRFPLERVGDFYLTIKELGGVEEVLKDGDKPLTAFQKLAETPSPHMLPSVKRSSVASISSIASNLSMHPAIEKLGMNDFSDDSAVKLYLNRYVQGQDLQRALKHDSDAASQSSSAFTVTPGDTTPPAPTPRASVQLSSPMRFALRVVIHPSDLPDGYIFDPYSQAVIPRAALAERRLSAQNPAVPIPTSPRDKILLMPANANVSEVLETALDRFGIVGGVVQGGDEVEEKLSKRRSISRVRYSLMVKNPKGTETILPPSRKILDAYAQPPLFKQQPTGKEARRRSADILAAYSPSPTDIQATDPIFILRNAVPSTPSPLSSTTSFSPLQAQSLSSATLPIPIRPGLSGRSETADTAISRYETPTEELPPALEKQLTTQELIQAQRAASRAAQHAMISAHENGNEGVDIVLQDDGKLRSTRDGSNGTRVRYSYIDKKGAEYDISDIMDAEWSQKGQRDSGASTSRSASQSTLSETGFQSAPTSPQSEAQKRRVPSYSDDEEAVQAVRSAPVAIGDSAASTLDGKSADKFQEALRGSGPEDSIDQRISRVLAKIKTGRDSRTHSRAGMSPMLDTGAFQTNGRISPAGSRPGSTEPMRRNGSRHQKQPSVNSLGSDFSSHESSHGPSTPGTAASGHNTSFTTVSPALRNGSALSNRVVYPSDLGLDTLFAMVGDGQPSPKPAPMRLLQPGAEELFGPDVPAPSFHDAHVQQWYNQMANQFDSLESRLDDLLSQVVL